MNDLISIIVPIYNVEKYIRRCIDSILNQTYNNLEIILVDDGSTDNCSQICDEYAQKDSRIRVIHKENGGVSLARNVGIELSNGMWISFVDADDWLEENFVETLYEKAKERKADVVLCGYNRIVGKNIEYINFKKDESEFNSEEYLINSLNPQTGFGFCHMKLFNKKTINNVRFNQKLQVGEDALFNEEISLNITKAIYIGKQLYNYRVNEKSVVRKFDANYVDKYLKAIQVNKMFVMQNYGEEQNIKINYYNYVAYHVLLIAVNYCNHAENIEKNNDSLKKVCNIEEFKEGIRKSNYKNISLTRKITLFTIKHKMYMITNIICFIRQKQNNIK